MEFQTEDWGGVRFTLPDTPTVYQQVEYDSRRFELSGMPQLIILWEMAKTIIEEWECEALPDYKADLTKITDPRAANVVEFAAFRTSAWRRGLDTIPKNS